MLASHLLDTLPSVMREWHRELHSGLPEGMSINMFRVLFFVDLGQNSPSFLARHLGVSPAAMSKMIEGLVDLELLSRRTEAHDRRQISLNLTKTGKNLIRKVRSQVERSLQARLDQLTPTQQHSIEQALLLLQSTFQTSQHLDEAL
jgi:DNA-binding MarR family transcriptional regulator